MLGAVDATLGNTGTGELSDLLLGPILEPGAALAHLARYSDIYSAVHRKKYSALNSATRTIVAKHDVDTGDHIGARYNTGTGLRRHV